MPLETGERRVVLTGVMAPVCSDLEPLFLKRRMEEVRAPVLRYLLADLQSRQLWAYSVCDSSASVWVSVRSPRIGMVSGGSFSGFVVRQINRPDEFMIARKPVPSLAMQDWIASHGITVTGQSTFQSDVFWDRELSNRRIPRGPDGELILDLGLR